MTKIIFFGNGPLSDYALNVLSEHCDIVFHAHTKKDLPEATRLKHDHPDAHGILASFGVLLKPDFLKIWEPEGILNIHPSLLPKYRGASPIESAILNGDQDFGVSIMKVAEAMDAGPIYYQEVLPASVFSSPLPEKSEIYKSLATAGANWLVENLNHLPKPKPQSGTPTFTKKLTTDLSPLHPETQTAEEMLNQIRAYEGFPKSRYNFFGLDCILLSAHLSPTFPEAPAPSTATTSPDSSNPYLYTTKSSFALKGTDGRYLLIDRLQPAGKKPMDTKSFLNGYRK